jgi:NADPH:quinone reductase-like Zn-dependent oxidoreductase
VRDIDALLSQMVAVLLTGHGGFEVLQYRDDLSLPKLASDEVLIEVAAAVINNTDINFRIGRYSKGVRSGKTATGLMMSRE